MTLRLKILLGLLLLSVLLYCYGGPVQQTPAKPTQWLPMYGMKVPKGLTIMYDSKSLVQMQANGTTLASGDFLVSYKTPIIIQADGKSIEVKTLLKSFVVDCKNMIASPVYDVWYTTEIRPTGADVPIAYKRYDVTKDYSEISRTSSIYQLLCGTII